MHAQSWQDRAAAKRASILAEIPAEWRLAQADIDRAEKQRVLVGPFMEQLLDPETVSIVNQDSVPLVEAIKSRAYTSEQVTRAFCKTAAVAHQIDPCLLEFFPASAIERAQELDRYLAENGRPMGPLHGLPVSLKDQFHVKGLDTTMGYVGWIGGNLGSKDPSEAHKLESLLVTDLLALGAVLYCKTSVPQTLMIGETVNNILGQTFNPHNRLLSSGGSSGGEGALMALRGSTIGLGTDIGGSVRIPAAFSGIFSLKPTPERVSYRGMANTNPGQNTYRSTVGPMGTSIEGVELMFRSLLTTEPWLRDPSVVPIPFRQDVMDSYLSRADKNGTATDRPLKIGVLWTNNIVQPHPPVSRGIKMLVDAIRKAGHKVVDWNPPNHGPAYDTHLWFIGADGGDDVHSHLARSGEPVIPIVAHAYAVRREAEPLLEYQKRTVQGLEYEAGYSDYWNSTAEDDGQIVDAVIMPVAAHAAVIPGQYYDNHYGEVINLLNYSAGVIPITKADKNVDVPNTAYQPKSSVDKLNWESYDAEVYDGAPVGLQIVGRKFEEEKILAIMQIVYAALQKA
ncbi:Acetamidase [Phialemonium atrogriseum]|uniref:amidase n=1 Tax=Phialemonium atrogriseum TaxID=1093897 RepID=A0AAJ0BWH2_9PEZI|nr:Acetamidase [Phialemonium atrogriseum]KAK1765526.1 Acetamidase [Phialemonium atrogriseum]